jgi:MFS family permease
MTLRPKHMPERMEGPMSNLLQKTDPYVAWRNRNFRYYELSWFSITFSKQIQTLAVSVYFVYIYDKGHAAMALGWMGLVQALPVMLLAIAGGQLADRFNRRRLLILMLFLSILTSIGLTVNALSGGASLWIYVLLAASATTQAIGGPSRSAMLPQLVPREIFTNAVTWNSTIFYIATATGPAIGGLMMAIWPNPAPAFVAVCIFRLLSMFAIAMIRYEDEDEAKESISLESVVAGIRFVWRTKLILATITLDMFAVLLGGGTYLLPIFAKDILQVGPTGLGFLRAADAIGAMCMAVLLVHLPPMRRAGVTLLWAVAGFGLAWVIFGLSTNFWLSLLMIFLVGALDNISVVVRHTLVQMLTPNEMRGRVSAVNNVFIVASNDLGGLESGVTAWLFGPVASVVGGGIGTILVVAASTLKWPQILKIGSLDAIKPADAEELEETEI